MYITVSGIDRKMERQFERIIDLFFEDAKVVFHRDQEAALEIQVRRHRRDDAVEAAVSLRVADTGEQFDQTRTIRVAPETSPEEARELEGRAARQALLRALESYTGWIQPWGILTGIRPTKLMHRKRRQRLGAEQATRQLESEYLLIPEKAKLLSRIVDRQLRAVPDFDRIGEEVSVYIGIPFCPTKCAYCTFPAYSIQGQQRSVDAFLEGLLYEMRQIGDWLKREGVGVTTVYFGGGTPTSIAAEELDRLCDQLFRSFPNADQIREITVEAGRPDTITREKLSVLKKYRIDRISINPQSYRQQTLDAIGRHHTVEETIEKFHLAREMGMANINMDLIIGLPGESLDEFDHTLRETEKLMPESLTVHTLSFKRASEMTQNRDKYEVADRDEIAKMMKRAEEWTNRRGYEPYYLYRQKNILGNLENVGYAKPGFESVYNIMIMEEAQTIIGLGCGASSKFVNPMTGRIERFANPKEPRAYNERFAQYTGDKIKLLERHFAALRSS